ncbi:MAG: SWIM zinc finger family protein [Bacteroidia bacterium]|nr:SWIM zinc finger family protein [Bacteroidia bacterium]
MLFNYKFGSDTSVRNSSTATEMNFSPDVHREPTFFNGVLNKHIPFREAISALHDIVVSDFRFKPKDKTDYKAWALQQENIWLAEYMKGAADVSAKLETVRTELNTVRNEKYKLLGPFNKAKSDYFNYIYKNDRDMWIVLDPVITVHPDEVFFECFSKDESSYGKLGCNYEVFTKINDFKCGTTNIDYSSALYDEFQKIRDYKETKFVIDPSGFEVKTEEQESFKEIKIDVPDSWVRGFLQVSSAMTLPAHSITFHPMDMHNILFLLKRKKEKIGPRSIRYILKPGQPVKLIFDPWNIELECPRSFYHGSTEQEIRVWGRRRMMLLERLIPVAKSFKVVLLGSGLPSFYIAEMEDMNFTLGLSGWTANDWSQQGNFDLLAPRSEADPITMQKVFMGLKQNWVEDADTLSKRIGIEKKLVLGALSAFTQCGKVIFDLNKNQYRIRELSKDALPMESLRFANEREGSATRFVEIGAVKLQVNSQADGTLKLEGTVKEGGKDYTARLVIDKDNRIASAGCNCYYHIRNNLYKGPCEHILALRIQYREHPTTGQAHRI